MTTITQAPATLTDDQLLTEMRVLAQRERRATVQLLAALTELDTRRLYLGQGYSSLFTYCTRGLYLSEGAAYRRIEAARAARRFPIIVDMLAEGALTLTTVCLLGRHLTPANHRTVLDAARYGTKREVEAQAAALEPRPPVLAFVRKVSAPARSGQGNMLPATTCAKLPLLSDRPDARAPEQIRGTATMKPLARQQADAARAGRLQGAADGQPGHA